jgi:hypothetical protein
MIQWTVAQLRAASTDAASAWCVVVLGSALKWSTTTAAQTTSVIAPTVSPNDPTPICSVAVHISVSQQAVPVNDHIATKGSLTSKRRPESPKVPARLW